MAAMNEDQDMRDPAEFNPRQDRDDGQREPQPKRVAVSGPTRKTWETMMRVQALGKARIEKLETELAAANACAQNVQNQFQALSVQFQDRQQHEEQLETQFMVDQVEINGMKDSYERATAAMLETQKLLMAQNETIQKLNRDMADRTIENIEMKARLRAPSTPISRQRKGRTANFPVLRNVGSTVQIPLDPVPLPGPASSTENPQDTASSVKTTIKKKWTKPGKAKPMTPVNKDEVTFWNNQLREPIYDKFGVKKYDEFMFHVPVSTEELRNLVVPGENDWRWDFSEGYNASNWNLILRKRIVALTLGAQSKEMAASVDPEWLDKQLKKKIQDIRGIWARLRPKLKANGGLETAAEAADRTAVVLEAQQMRKKSNSAKDRKYHGRILTICLTIEIKIHEGGKDLEAWKRLFDIVERLDTIGMSSEEEDEAEFNGQPMKIFKVKVCVWRAPEIADYMRFVDKESGLLAEQHNNPGPGKVMRVPVEDVGTSRAPIGLPECMYSSEWLKKLGRFDYQDLQVSEEEFGMLVAATSRMAM
ncbi:hypothetical protein C8R44DRAFT_755078 [Mycena epipterygia]|nr:hypothetical protein C8R44DRAFT_755078 [Mycena epipterygia]